MALSGLALETGALLDLAVPFHSPKLASSALTAWAWSMPPTTMKAAPSGTISAEYWAFTSPRPTLPSVGRVPLATSEP